VRYQPAHRIHVVLDKKTIRITARDTGAKAEQRKINDQPMAKINASRNTKRQENGTKSLASNTSSVEHIAPDDSWRTAAQHDAQVMNMSAVNKSFFIEICF
jgi:hypothetical protein